MYGPPSENLWGSSRIFYGIGDENIVSSKVPSLMAINICFAAVAVMPTLVLRFVFAAFHDSGYSYYYC